MAVFHPGVLEPTSAHCVFFFLWYAGLSLLWPLPLQSTGSGRAGPAAMAHGPSRSAACGIFPDRGTNPRPLHQQADSQPLRHQGSPSSPFSCISITSLYLTSSFLFPNSSLCTYSSSSSPLHYRIKLDYISKDIYICTYN